MNSKRLREIEDNLSLLREQLVGMEQTKIMAPAEERPRIEQRIRRELKAPIKQYEEEYWQILAGNADSLPIPEPEAEVAIAEIVEQVHQLEARQANTYSDEVLQILREIRDKLNQPGPPAAAKLKGIISSIPPFIGVSYEAELDTENFFRTYFPTFTRLIKGAVKKKAEAGQQGEQATVSQAGKGSSDAGDRPSSQPAQPSQGNGMTQNNGENSTGWQFNVSGGTVNIHPPGQH